MQTDKKPMGRPTTRIDTGVLLALRKELGLTQEELAEKVYAAARKPWASASVLKNTGQRWETKGTISASLVVHLAHALGTTPPVLKGEMSGPAPDRIDELVSLLHRRAESGSYAELNKSLERYRDAGDEQPVEELARDLNQDLEVAHLIQDKAVFERVSILTGMTSREMLRPTSHNGIWLLIASGPLGPPRYELLFGVSHVRYQIGEECRALAKSRKAMDMSISFDQEGPWYKINWVLSPHIYRTFRFVRCQPSDKGLAWVIATDWDQFWLDELPSQSYQYASSVTGFDGVEVPAELTNLRVVLSRWPSKQELADSEGKASPAIVLVFEGALPSLPQAQLDFCVRSGESHGIVTNWLVAGLWESLQPELSDWPLDYWSFQAGVCCIDVMLEIPVGVLMKCGRWSDVGRRFRISLAEMTPEGELRPTPWTDHCVGEVLARLASALTEARARSAPAPD